MSKLIGRSRLIRATTPPQLVPGRAFTIGHRHTRLLPTPLGLGFLVLLLLLFLGGLNYGNSLALALACLLAGIGLTTLFHTWCSLPGLCLHPEGGEAAFAGESLCFPITLSAANARHGLELRPATGVPLQVDLEPGQPRRCLLLVPAERRGRQPLGSLQVTTTRPLGLYRAWVRLEVQSTALVWPRPARPSLPLPFRPGRQPTSAAGTGLPEDSGDFGGHRPWRPGDSPRSIDWKVLARGQGLQTKVFEQATQQECWLEPQMAPEAGLEGRLSRLCAWLLDAERQGIPAGLRLSGALVPPGLGQHHLRTCLDRLAVEGLDAR